MPPVTELRRVELLRDEGRPDADLEPPRPPRHGESEALRLALVDDAMGYRSHVRDLRLLVGADPDRADSYGRVPGDVLPTRRDAGEDSHREPWPVVGDVVARVRCSRWTLRVGGSHPAVRLDPGDGGGEVERTAVEAIETTLAHLLYQASLQLDAVQSKRVLRVRRGPEPPVGGREIRRQHRPANARCSAVDAPHLANGLVEELRLPDAGRIRDPLADDDHRSSSRRAIDPVQRFREVLVDLSRQVTFTASGVDLRGHRPRHDEDGRDRCDRDERSRLSAQKTKRDDDGERKEADDPQPALDAVLRPAELAVRKGGDRESVRLVVGEFRQMEWRTPNDVEGNERGTANRPPATHAAMHRESGRCEEGRREVDEVALGDDRREDGRDVRALDARVPDEHPQRHDTRR